MLRNQPPTKNFNRLVIFSLAALLFLYSCIRAGFLSITHDEAIIYLKSMDASLWQIFNYRILPQDHMLNTLMIKLSCLIFPDTPFFIRLPNLIAHLLYLSASYLIATKFTDRKMSIIAFALLNLNPYLLDFFSVARGYGLSVSMMFVSIYFLLRFVKHEKAKDFISSYIFAVFSVLSVFSLLIYFVALIGWTGLYMINQLVANPDKQLQRRRIFFTTITAAIAVLFLYIKLSTALSQAADAGFIHSTQYGNIYSNTIRSVIYNATYNEYPKTVVTIMSLVYGLFILAGIIRLVSFAVKRKPVVVAPLFVVLTLFFGSLAGILFLHHFQGVVYPTNRTSTFIYPLITLPVIIIFNHEIKPRFLKYPGIGLAGVLSVGLLYFTLSNINFKYYNDWQYDASGKKMIKIIESVHAENPDKKVHLGIDWLFEPSTNFYRITRHLDWLAPVDRSGFKKETYDYYYVLEKDTTGKFFRNKKLIRVFPVSGSLLYKNQ